MERFRARLAHAEALPQLTLMGVLCGLLTGVIAILFRLSIDLPLSFFLPASEQFESLPTLWRFVLPVGGALLLSIIYTLFRQEDRSVGVSHVIERYQLHQARLPARNAVFQFIGGVVALLSGQSLGREGPAVHLGAACSSALGQKLSLPNNSLRVLVACGIAAAIAASFNTPLAGVIFAMEVVLMEYTVMGFLPVIIAAVCGSVLAQLVFGTDPAFFIPALHDMDLIELPWLLVCGIVTGLLASFMLSCNTFFLKQRKHNHWLRFLVVGVITGSIACVVPEIMGPGYDTLQSAMLGEIAITWLLVIVAAKTLASILALGLGLPGGGIGPMLVIGACLGGVMGMIGAELSTTPVSASGFYATLGMGAMMAAALNAPLAALIAIMELTHNPQVLMPAMLVIVSATLTTRMTTRLPGLFLIGHDPKRYASPVRSMLNRAGVTSIMIHNLARHRVEIPWQKAIELLESKPEWILIEEIDQPRYILRPADLAHYLTQADKATWEQDHPINLREIPAMRYKLFPIHPGATLQEALSLMNSNNGHAVYVTRPAAPLMSDVAGIVTREAIESYYQV